MMTTILVTGGTGYIGSHTCVELINAGYDVIVMDNLYNSSEAVLGRIEQITGKAPKVYAIDVGYGQLAWKLRTDERVVNMERTNIRYVTKDMLDESPEFASIDVAFISLEKALPVVYSLLSEKGECVALIKPQFEAGREHVGKKGVVKDPAIHFAVIRRVLQFAHDTGFSVLGLTFSPVKGPEGNIEYLTWLKKDDITQASVDETTCRDMVEKAHNELD